MTPITRTRRTTMDGRWLALAILGHAVLLGVPIGQQAVSPDRSRAVPLELQFIAESEPIVVPVSEWTPSADPEIAFLVDAVSEQNLME